MCGDMELDYEMDKRVSMNPDGSKEVTKCGHIHKHKDVEVAGAMTTMPTPQPAPACPQPCPPVQDKCANDSSWGCMWVVWIILIFIIILIIVMAIFWAVKPNFVTRECEDTGDNGGCEVDLARAALYAFVITFFLVLIGCAIFWCCR